MAGDQVGNDRVLSVFGMALDAILERNKARDAGPASLRGLAAAIARDKQGDEPTPQQIDQERRSLRRYRLAGGRAPRVETVDRIARVLGVTVDELPVQRVRRQTLRDLEQLVRELERERDEALRQLDEELRRANP